MGSSLGLPTGEAFDVKVQPVVAKRDVITLDEWEKAARLEGRLIRRPA